MISSCPCFWFALGFEAIILAFGSRCVNFYLRLLLCTGRGQAISQYRHLYWTLETGDIPSNRHPPDQWPRQHRDRSPGHKHGDHVSSWKYFWWKFHIYVEGSRVIWNSSDWLLLSLYITGNFPRLPRVRSDCQVQGSHLTPHDRSFQTKVPWFYWGFFFTGQGFLSNFNFHWLQN